MTSVSMREDPLFMRNNFDVTGKWNIPLVRKQDISLDKARLIACSDTRANDNTKSHAKTLYEILQGGEIMIDGNVNEFVDNLYYGSEMYFIFKGKKYFIQGWVKDSIHYLVLDYDYETEVYDPDNPECNKYIWEHSSYDSNECVQAFLDAPLWAGKKFYDVENEITWADP